MAHKPSLQYHEKLICLSATVLVDIGIIQRIEIQNLPETRRYRRILFRLSCSLCFGFGLRLLLCKSRINLRSLGRMNLSVIGIGLGQPRLVP